MSTRTQDVKFIVLIFFNLSCIVLCGWYGIQKVLDAQGESAKAQHRHDEGTKNPLVLTSSSIYECGHWELTKFLAIIFLNETVSLLLKG
jgi:hypothetical protein